MYLLGLLFYALFFSASGKIVPKEDVKLKPLEFASEHTFEAEIISLTAHSVQTVKYWRTPNKIRIDYNKGNVITVIDVDTEHDDYPYGIQYEVHPETTKLKKNYMICNTKNLTEQYEDQDVILPENTYEYRNIGSEIIECDTIYKFEHAYEDFTSDNRYVIWAILDIKKESWIPVRYEKISFNTWLDNEEEHTILNIYNYETKFNIDEVFDMKSSHDCEIDELRSSKSRRENINSENSKHLDHVFNSFKKKYKKVYADDEEHSLRKKLYLNSMRRVLENNNKNTGFKLTINEFADRTPEEMKKFKGLVRSGKREPGTHSFPYTKSEIKELASDLPVEFDLREQGIITPVKHQEECGSCWTFGTTSAVEGVLARNNGGRLLRLSQQALLDCSWGYGSAGCDGGSDIIAYRWMIDYGLPTEEEYGIYENQVDFCRIENMTRVYPIRGFTNVPALSVEATKIALVNHGPLSVSIHASASFSLYEGGIFYDTECDSSSLDHEVTLVGYGNHLGDEFWILKNSWGQNWGIDGYIYISVRDNNCGVTVEPTYPIV